ncbi:MAG TPA: ABC transporter ATP-binding protein [Candidatus Paceibacterota bacterium]|nr:ABC transporter ATP-binding protein [Candidatus Paceibacterota bacterium]
MSQPIIEIKGVGKRYDIMHQQGGYITLRDVFANILRSPFKFAKYKAKQVIGIDTKENFWALKDVSFDVMPGEVVGIIGANGAGKSTLLKILTGITPPTEGEIKMGGRVASLLEVGTGFHPELTGRENIFLNGAILGMTRKEIARKFDEIVEFSGIGKFLDTPVKRYSSGMYVRLAFSVAAHMEPDILLVDEVLAVGDAEFQKKCLGKMEEVTGKAGRTILFISHNMAAIQRLCHKTVLLEKGKIKMFGKTEDVINAYLNDGQVNAIINYVINPEKEAQISKITILNKENEPHAKIPIGDPFSIQINYEIMRPTPHALLSVMFYAGDDLLLLSSESDKDAHLFDYAPGKYTTTVSIPPFLFNVGMHFFDVRFHRPELELIDHKQNINFEILDIDNPRSIIFHGNHMGKIASMLDYQTMKIR